MFSHRGGLSHQLPRRKVAGRSWGPYRFGSSTPSLCTFLPTSCVSTCLSAGFAQGCRTDARAGVGFPEFTQFFNHSHLWKLQSTITAGCSAIELLRKMRPCWIDQVSPAFGRVNFYSRRVAGASSGVNLSRSYGSRARRLFDLAHELIYLAPHSNCLFLILRHFKRE
jgi:hypothetical protein